MYTENHMYIFTTATDETVACICMVFLAHVYCYALYHAV